MGSLIGITRDKNIIVLSMTHRKSKSMSVCQM